MAAVKRILRTLGPVDDSTPWRKMHVWWKLRADCHAKQIIRPLAIAHTQHTRLANIPQTLHKFPVPILHRRPVIRQLDEHIAGARRRREVPRRNTPAAGPFDNPRVQVRQSPDGIRIVGIHGKDVLHPLGLCRRVQPILSALPRLQRAATGCMEQRKSWEIGRLGHGWFLRIFSQPFRACLAKDRF
jgi:hypothetical protein